MLSNFGSKKPEQEADKPSATTQTSAFRAGPSASSSMPPRPAAPSPKGERGTQSLIGPDLTIQGNLISSGEVQVDGEVEGDLHGTHVLIGEKARIQGAVNAEEVIVRGHVMGSVRGRIVKLQSTSHVEGDVHHQSLSIEQGAYFEGKSRRSDDPLAGVQRPQSNTAGGAMPVANKPKPKL
ncbi:MAG: polymer-forming cytoskeletal protein [Pseudomonadota bacterium]